MPKRACEVPVCPLLAAALSKSHRSWATFFPVCFWPGAAAWQRAEARTKGPEPARLWAALESQNAYKLTNNREEKQLVLWD